MSYPNPCSSLFTQVDISPTQVPNRPGEIAGYGDEHAILLRQLLNASERQNQLLGEMVGLMTGLHKQRQNELGQWKEKNPELSVCCKKAADALSKVHVEFLDKLTEEVRGNFDELMDSEFMLNEFVDRFGPRLAHLNGVLQVLSTLGTTPPPPATVEAE